MATQNFEGGNLNELTKSGTVLVNFTGSWCGPCQMFAPILEEVSSDFKVIKVDVDENKELAQEMKVQGVPTTFVFKDGQIKDSLMGFIPKEVLIDRVEKA